MKSLWASLATFRNKIEVVKKDANNPFFKSKYADLPSILDAIKKPLAESGLAITHNMINSDWWYALVTTVIDIDSWELITSEFPVFWSKPQEVGSSVSYARRYNLQALLDIPTDEDDDGNSANTATRTKKEYKEAPKWQKELVEFIEEIRIENDVNHIKTLVNQAWAIYKTEKQLNWIKEEARKRTDTLNDLSTPKF